MVLSKRRLGRTGEHITILGLGGEGILRTFGREKEAYRLINRALDLGINYFDSARAYAGSESYYGAALGERRDEIFLTSKSHARDKKGALLHLEETLGNMRTDHLDLWQVHDVRTRDDVDKIFGDKGAIEAFIEAREKGVVKYIGLTGHSDPGILIDCLKRFNFDTLLIPVNPAEPAYKSFLEKVFSLALEKDMGVIGMKVYLKGFPSRLPGYTSMEGYLRFALTQRISTAIVGCDSVAQLEQNVEFAERFNSMSQREMEHLLDLNFKYGRELMYYKTI